MEWRSMERTVNYHSQNVEKGLEGISNIKQARF
jgi:hypothetical protein